MPSLQLACLVGCQFSRRQAGSALVRAGPSERGILCVGRAERVRHAHTKPGRADRPAAVQRLPCTHRFAQSLLPPPLASCLKVSSVMVLPLLG